MLSHISLCLSHCSAAVPGEAQKIDRIINCFGRHYFRQRPDIFRNEDAAYVLAYSVIMLNTDAHNNQVRIVKGISPVSDISFLQCKLKVNKKDKLK